ncbi:MAG: DUF429 domain-containing protein [Candidatus Limnocylindrales bacterium]
MSAPNVPTFQLRFPLAEVPFWAARYSSADDSAVEAIGKAARRRGWYTRDEFLVVTRWKTQRTKSRCEKNDEASVEATTRLALSTPDERLRIKALTRLHGVQFPTASVLLHLGHRELYPIIAYRALWSLRVEAPPSYYSFGFWSAYTQACRLLAAEAGVWMRTLDRALWQYAKERQALSGDAGLVEPTPDVGLTPAQSTAAPTLDVRPMMSKVMGVDAAAGTWLAVLLVDGAFVGADLQPSLAALLERHPDVGVVAIDIPIGLPVGGTRPADDAARTFVGPARASSVFETFPREELEATSHDEAVEVARRLLSRAPSQQAFALRKRIFEVAHVAEIDRRIVEVHPEVSFRAMKGAPLRYSKHSWSGIAERRALLAARGIVLPDDLSGGDQAAADDVVDAAAAAWSAQRVATGTSGTLPTPPPSDAALGGVINY